MERERRENGSQVISEEPQCVWGTGGKGTGAGGNGIVPRKGLRDLYPWSGCAVRAADLPEGGLAGVEVGPLAE